MNGAVALLAFVKTAVLISMLPIALWVVNLLLLRRLDNRGMYQVAPFPWLPWLSGALLTSAAFDGMEITSWLKPEGIWLSDFWAISFDELYRTWLDPRDVLLALIAGIVELNCEADEGGWRLPFLGLTGLLTAVVAVLAWRSWQASRGVLLFLWLTLSHMVLIYTFLIVLAWLTHWVNFWLLPIFFVFLYLFDKDDDRQPRLPL